MEQQTQTMDVPDVSPETLKAFTEFGRAIRAVARVPQEQTWIHMAPSTLLLLQGDDDRDKENALGLVRVLHYYTHFSEGPDGELISTANSQLVSKETMRNAVKLRDWYNKNPQAAALLPFWKHAEP
jgi:hypothetical protein